MLYCQHLNEVFTLNFIESVYEKSSLVYQGGWLLGASSCGVSLLLFCVWTELG